VLGIRSVRLWVFGDHQHPASAPDGAGPAAPGSAAAGLFVVAEDVTELLRLQQERLDDAIKQRGMPVREVHHRIKNNLPPA